MHKDKGSTARGEIGDDTCRPPRVESGGRRTAPFPLPKFDRKPQPKNTSMARAQIRVYWSLVGFVYFLCLSLPVLSKRIICKAHISIDTNQSSVLRLLWLIARLLYILSSVMFIFSLYSRASQTGSLPFRPPDTRPLPDAIWHHFSTDWTPPTWTKQSP